MRMATCHPDKVYRAKGLCESCYRVAYYLAHKAARHAYYVTNRERVLANIYLRKYGLSTSKYRTTLANQGGVCKICGRTDAGGTLRPQQFLVDHNHRTGKVRGLLCHSCNTGLACFREDRSILESAVLYLRGVV